MRVVIQRVSSASVKVEGELKASIGAGLMILVGTEDVDTEEDINWLCGKLSKLRIFDDENGVPNLSVKDINGALLVVSQFTLFASTKKGNRPSWLRASKPGVAEPMYNKFVQTLEVVSGLEVKTGSFGAYMEVELVNDGPITIIMDTQNKE